MLRGVIFDVDGTLVDSNDAHARSWVEALSEAGYCVRLDVIRPMIGMGSDKLLPAAAGLESDSIEGKRLGERRWEIFEHSYLPRLEPTPGARALVNRLRNEGLKIVVASSAGGDELGALLKAAGVADLIEEMTSSSDAEDSKPDPDIVLAAVRKSGLESRELIMVGDTPYDIQAATGAGVPLAAVLTGGWRVEELAGAVAIYDDPAAMLKWFDPRKWDRSD